MFKKSLILFFLFQVSSSSLYAFPLEIILASIAGGCGVLKIVSDCCKNNKNNSHGSYSNTSGADCCDCCKDCCDCWGQCCKSCCTPSHEHGYVPHSATSMNETEDHHNHHNGTVGVLYIHETSSSQATQPSLQSSQEAKIESIIKRYPAQSWQRDVARIVLSGSLQYENDCEEVVARCENIFGTMSEKQIDNVQLRQQFELLPGSLLGNANRMQNIFRAIPAPASNRERNLLGVIVTDRFEIYRDFFTDVKPKSLLPCVIKGEQI